MKILGKTKLKPKTVEVLVGEDEEGECVVVKLRALRMSELNDLKEDLGAKPLAPLLQGEVEKNDDGSKKLDEDGKPIPKRKLSDKGYKKAKDDYAEAFTISYLMRSAGDQLESSLARDDYESSVAFYNAVKDELIEAVPDAQAYANIIHALTMVMSLDQFAVGEKLLGVKRSKPLVTTTMGASGN